MVSMTDADNPITIQCQLPFGAMVPATFVRRDNRFRVQAKTGDGQLVAAHLPNSGRLHELLVPGHEVWLTPAPESALQRRLTAYDLALVKYADRLVSVDARLPGSLVAEALRQGGLPAFSDYSAFKREVALGQSRIDFRLDGHPPCWLEIKSVTLVIGSVARFPDAPTVRGRRHLAELTRAVDSGDRAAAVFVVQRDDADSFSPHHAADPDFGRALCEAANAGVEVHALSCRVTPESIQLVGPLPVNL
jgi:sugar fermentation stimulation protein A